MRQAWQKRCPRWCHVSPSRGKVVQHDSPQCVAVRSFMFSMHMMHFNVDSFTGLFACSCWALIVANLCCSSTFDRPLSSSTSLRSISSIFADLLLDWEASVFLLLAGFNGVVEVARLEGDAAPRGDTAFRRFCNFGCGRATGAMVGDDESWVKSMKSPRSSA